MKLNNQLDILKKVDSSSNSDELFGIKKISISHFSHKTELVPQIDKNYIFDELTTLSILSGFKFNKRVLIQGIHGTGIYPH